MLSSSPAHTALPASDLARARRFYEETLGFGPGRVNEGGVLYDAGQGTRFLVFPSAGRAAGTHTQIGFTVADLQSTVADLRARGVVFESYDMPSFDPATQIATFGANRSAWFKDTEGNLIGLVEFTT